ncbi:Cinnamoyl-CoA reductase 1 [Camellia lanceoleosa]|uniref:Cinnamoyl-CoA reductase 1 n=1 Tax=Camellia lanceoleosa TaxID=1840588 RepID=A0ACC0ISQ7_9ERIC|nr:Cinnamoyl-CoA reductase 1 [Camellia lanceoleosa]
MSSPSQPRPTTHLTETETGQGTNTAIPSITLSVAATETIGLKESTTSSAGPHQKKELLAQVIKGTNNILTAAKELGVRRVVVMSSISAITPSSNWLADKVKNKDCWTDVEYCK